MARKKFELNEEEEEKAEEFIEQQLEKSKESGTIYDRFSYEFNPTSIGTSVTIIDNYLDEKENLTDVSNW